MILLPSAHFEEALTKPLYHMGHSHTVGLVKELNYLNRLDGGIDRKRNSEDFQATYQIEE